MEQTTQANAKYRVIQYSTVNGIFYRVEKRLFLPWYVIGKSMWGYLDSGFSTIERAELRIQLDTDPIPERVVAYY